MLKVFKKVAPIVLGLSLLVATPSFAYEVKKGDTMNEIAVTYAMTLKELAEVNPEVKDLDLIFPGQTIKTIEDNQQQIETQITAKEKDLMARLVRAEAESEIYAGKVAVAVVVLNRVDSEDFPDTVKEVINQPGQFTPVSNGEITKDADTQSVEAVEEAVRTDRSEGAGSLYFYNPDIAVSRWLDSKETTKVVGNHVFKK
jgi:N-acetylmuramoyl-L-alanine amidase